MVLYRCERCEEVFERKYVYEKHLNRKIPCEINKTNRKNETMQNYCETCNKTYSRADALKRHLKSNLHKLINEKHKNIKNKIKENKIK